MKGQFSVDYYVSIILFVLFVVYILFQLTRFLPTYIDEIKDQRIRTEAYQISELLINDPGYPGDWENLGESQRADIKRIGLSNTTQNKTNLISVKKINSLNSLCGSVNGYNILRGAIGTDYQLSIILVDKTTGGILVNCIPPEQLVRATRVDFRRIVSTGQNSYGELILQLW